MPDADAECDPLPFFAPRVERFKYRLQESPAERAMHAAIEAVDDLKVVIWTVKTRPQIAEIRATIETLIEQLTIASSVALTCDEHFEDRQ